MVGSQVSKGIGVALACFLVHCAIAVDEPVAATYDVVGVKAIDGDSIVVRFPSDLEVEVRLVSIDCPEHGQSLSEKATEYTQNWITGRLVRLVTGEEERDRYKRLLALVEADGETLNEALVEAGLAVVEVIPPNRLRVDDLLAAQASAHEQRRGIWGPDGLREEPRSFRARRRNGDESPVRPLRYENHIVAGNRRSRVAHWPGCRHVEEMLPENVRLFTSVAEAEAAGYRMEKGRR